MAQGPKLAVSRWWKRIAAAKDCKKEWEKSFEPDRCYQYWRGNQLVSPVDEFGERKIIVNKIHADVKTTLPSVYYYNPFARVTAAPEKANDQGQTVDEKAQLLQDTANSAIRDPIIGFRENTFLALKEAQWAFGVVEVGYSAEFEENPQSPKPPLREKPETVDSPGSAGLAEQMPPQPMEDGKEPDPLAELEVRPKTEQFFVKYIPANQFYFSASDNAIVEANDWCGYWEWYNLEDVKAATGWQNTADLKATGADDRSKSEKEEESGSDRVKIWKVWDLRRKTRLVLAEDNEDVCLSEKPYDRLPLFPLRFDVDPKHAYPIPPIHPQLGPQDEYNHSRDYLRRVRNGTVPRYTYDEDGIDAKQIRKLEANDIGTYVPRKGGTTQVIEPINQPTFSDNAIQTLTLAEKEMSDVQGSSGSPQVSQTKTATQAVIRNTKEQVQDSFERSIVADWLGAIIQELLALMTEKMLLAQWIGINVDPDGPFVMLEAAKVQQQVKQITAQSLKDAQKGLRWQVKVDVESLSPVSEQEKLQQWLTGLQMIADQAISPILALSPELLKRTLELLGMKSQRDIGLIQEALMKLTQMRMMAPPVPGSPGMPGPQPVGPGGPAGAPPGPPPNMQPGAPPPGSGPQPMGQPA